LTRVRFSPPRARYKVIRKYRVLTDLDEMVAVITTPEVEEEAVVEEAVEGELR